MTKQKKSGSAIFMYCVIAITALTATACFILHYGGIVQNSVILWVGITTFTILYHFWVRIIMGNVTKLFRIHHKQAWFRELPFEKKLYRLLRVKTWKDRTLTYNPDAFSVKDRTLEEIADTMAKSEVDHWINEIISLSTLLFATAWGVFPIFCGTAILAMLFDAQFIVIQRYNRPRIVKILQKKRVSYVESIHSI